MYQQFLFFEQNSKFRGGEVFYDETAKKWMIHQTKFTDGCFSTEIVPYTGNTEGFVKKNGEKRENSEKSVVFDQDSLDLESSTDSAMIQRGINPDHNLEDSLNLYPYQRNFHGIPSYSPNREQSTPIQAPITPQASASPSNWQALSISVESLNQQSRTAGQLETPSTVEMEEPVGFRSISSTFSGPIPDPVDSSTPIRSAGGAWARCTRGRRSRLNRQNNDPY